MKRIIIIAGISLAVGLGAGWLAFGPTEHPKSNSERKILYYRDPMNPQLTSPTPKKASDGMDFVPVYDESGGSGKDRVVAYYKDPMHPWYTSDKPGKAPDCGMDLVPVYAGEGGSNGIRINPATVQNIGVKTAVVEKRMLKKVIRTVGNVGYDETKVYSVNTKIMGWVEKLYVDYTGKVVRKGEPLMELYSPELVTTQEEYLQAIRYRRQLQSSTIQEARKGAEDLLESAKRRLHYWDISDAEIRQLEERGTPKKTMTIYSPVDGIVADKMVFQGQNVMAGMDLYKIADISTVWVLADMYQYELPWVKIGQRAEVELSYIPGKTFTGTIAYVYPTLNAETKTAKARVVVENTKNLVLKPEMFATVRIIAPVAEDAVAVPDQAIIRSGERNVVVMALGGGYFEPREVRLGLMADGYVQVLDGIREGETIVTSAQFLIDSESNLKAAVSLMKGQDAEDKKMPGMDSSAAKQTAPMEQHRDHGSAIPAAKQSNPPQAMKQVEEEGMEMSAEASRVVDPVCGMSIPPSPERSYVSGNKTYYFCSDGDLEKFRKDPEKYLAGEHNHD